MYISQNQKNTKHWIQSKQRNGGTTNKHCNLLIYTVSRNRVLIERCSYNIQTTKYHNNAELIFLQHIYQEMSTKTLKLRKKQKFTFLKIQKTQNTGYIQNNGTGEPNINTAICWFTQPHSTECYLNIITTVQTIKWHNVAELNLLQFYCVQLQFNNYVELDVVITVKKVHQISVKTVGKWQIDNIRTNDTNSTLI